MSDPLPGLTIDSVTGVEVSLPVAGPGARSYAFLIDWHIRLLLGFAWYVTAYLLYNGRLSLAAPATNDARWFGGVLAPALAIFLLYHYVLELLMQGRTPGKRIAGVRIVGRDGGAAGIGPLLTRNVFRLIDSLPIFYGIGLIAVMITRDKVRIGDMAAGTLLIYDTGVVQLPAETVVLSPNARHDPVAAEAIAELLERWPSLFSSARRQLALKLLARCGVPTSDLAAADDATLRRQLQQLTVSGP